MTRLREWMDISETGDAVSLVAAGWVADGNGGFGTDVVDQSQVYHDSEGNGGLYSILVNAGTFAGDEWMAWRTPALATPVNQFYSRFHYRRGIASNMDAVVCFWSQGVNASDSLGCLTIMPDGHLKLRSGGYPTNLGAGTLLATSTLTLAPNHWYLIEVGITIGNVGAYEVRVDRSSVGWIPAGVGDTQPGSITTVDHFWYVSENNSGSGGRGDQSWFDDMAADDSTWVGESLITAVFPNGYGHTTQLTPHGYINNWQNVDERPPSDTDYNDTTTPGEGDSYHHTALPGAASTILAFLVVSRVTTIGGAIATGQTILRSAGTDYLSSSHSLPLTPSIITDLYVTDPATSVAWVVGALNAAEFGFKFNS